MSSRSAPPGGRRGYPGRRPRGPLAWIAAALLVVPVVELAVVIQVGRLIGPWPTVALLLAESALGAWLLRREGAGAWRAFRATMARGEVPARELADGILVLTGGLLLLTPGFVTDIVGFLAILPPTRAFARRRLTAWIGRRLLMRGGARPRTVPGVVVVDVDPADSPNDDQEGPDTRRPHLPGR